VVRNIVGARDCGLIPGSLSRQDTPVILDCHGSAPTSTESIERKISSLLWLVEDAEL
jgi:hypothetical protein